ncbi:MAG TPA: competence/damage-inducible protein A [Desulfobacterales bacterium]|nr:competence/damage-inducible protein A [Desulfobacterales bacterium]HIP38595.1 competence/damage-inducible protein A [Desulfocapsa sulfexigens]
MNENPNFYSVIIGTELLNGRRSDSHFKTVNDQLVSRGWEHKANFVIKDDPQLLHDIFVLIKTDSRSVMFSFGGIGSTPDDFTREVASAAFTGSGLVRHKEAETIIIDRIGQRAFPHPIKMADLPVGSKLVHNPFNKMPGFQLDDKYFFVPGFPEMAHPMIVNILDEFYPENNVRYSCNFIAECSETMLIDIMNNIPDSLNLSCLPSFENNTFKSEIYLSNENQATLQKWCAFFKDELEKMGVFWKEIC